MGRRFAVGRRWRFSLLLLLLATVVVGPLLAPTLRATTGLGFLNTRGGGDSPFLLFRLGQLVTALADGHFPVRWMPDAAYGLGYPFFSYYAALPYYIGAALHFWGFGLVAAVKLTQWLGSVLAAWAMCGLVSRFGGAGQARGEGSNTRFGRRTAWLAAAAYAFAPYHLVNIYVRGDSLTEFWAMGLYPLILWTAARLWDRPGRGRAILFSLSYTALILTHNISALIFSPFVLLFFILLAAGTPAAHRGWKAGAALAVGLVLGLVLSAFFWLPALGEQGAVQLTTQTSGYYHYSNHFRTLASTSDSAGLVQSTLIFDYDVAGMTPFSMGLVQAILTAAGLIAALLRLCRSGIRSLNPLTLFALLTLLISTLMITPASRPLWDHLPLLPMVQFPWRFLSVQALAAALLIAQVLDLDSPGRRVSRALSPAILTVLIVFSALAGLRPDAVALAAGDITAERMQLYEWFSGNIGTTTRYEYLPRAVVPRLYTSESIVTGRPMDVRILAGEAIATRLETRTGKESWQVLVRTDSATIAFPVLYWPGWQARVDGKLVQVRPAESLGTITLDLPAGDHDVVLTLGRTPLRLMSEIASLLALAGCAIYWVRRGLGPALTAQRLLALMVPILVSAAAVAAGLRLIPPPSLPADDLTWDFGQQAYLHHNPDGVPFGDVAIMQSYRYSERTEGGWDVAIKWSELNRSGLEAELALVYPAEAVQSVSYTLATDRRPLVEPDTAFFLPLPQAAPPGPWLLRLRVLDADGFQVPALTSAGNHRGELYLRPVWVPVVSSGAAVDDRARLLSAQAAAMDPDTLEVTLQWAVGKRMAANYKIATRLYDRAGNEWARLDTQPGYGFYPTSVWEPGTTFGERLAMEVPYGLPPGDYYLTVFMYDAVTLAPTWGPVERPITLTTVARYRGSPLLHRFTPAFAAASLNAPESIHQGDPLSLTVGWAALEEPDAPLFIRWELIGGDGSVAASGSGEPVPGSDPTGWPAGSLVLGRLQVPTDPRIPPESYMLRLTLVDPQDGRRLGLPWDATTINIKERPRSFVLPEVETPVGVEFGSLIRLEGINLVQTIEAIDLTLVWRALDAPAADLIVFVHLFDPATEEIAVQSDATPRANSYPTSRWAEDEVVEDQVTLSLAGVPAGQYRLAVGLYRMAGEQSSRLPAVDAEGDPVPDGRVILPAEVAIP